MSEQLDSLLEGPRILKLNSGKEISIRPFTFGSFGLCKKLGLKMFSGDQDVEDPDPDAELDDDTMWQLQVFFWMQSQPVNEVLGAVRNNTWKERAEDFGFDLPIHIMRDLMSEVNRISSMAQEAAVDVLPKGDDGEESAPGN